MRVFAIHDDDGNITSLVTMEAESRRRMGFSTESSQLVSEVDIPKLGGKLNDENTQERLLEIIEKYRVEVVPGKRKLVTKARGK